jgi:hypothetical protein
MLLNSASEGCYHTIPRTRVLKAEARQVFRSWVFPFLATTFRHRSDITPKEKRTVKSTQHQTNSMQGRDGLEVASRTKVTECAPVPSECNFLCIGAAAISHGLLSTLMNFVSNQSLLNFGRSGPEGSPSRPRLPGGLNARALCCALPGGRDA